MLRKSKKLIVIINVEYKQQAGYFAKHYCWISTIYNKSNNIFLLFLLLKYNKVYNLHRIHIYARQCTTSFHNYVYPTVIYICPHASGRCAIIQNQQTIKGISYTFVCVRILVRKGYVAINNKLS